MFYGETVADKRNATSSWSGYLHQGQAGLLVALREINRLKELIQSLDGWFLIFENAEDFDIQNTGGVVSRHQVKAYKDAKYPSSVKDVLGVQVYKKNKIITKGFQFRKLKDGTLTDIEVDEQSRFLHVITEIYGFNLKKAEFEKYFPKADFISNPNRIQLYEYEKNKLYCPLVTGGDSTLENYCLKEIKIYLQSIGNPEAQEKEVQRKIYYYLIKKLDLQIKLRHLDKQNIYPRLDFINIIEWISTPPNTQSYLISTTKRKLATTINDYILDLRRELGEIDDSIVDRIQSCSLEIYHLEDSDFLQFLKDINPNEQKAGELTVIDDVIDLVKKDSFRAVFLFCMLKISGSPYVLSERGYKKDGGYILSLITENEMLAKSLKHKIGQNSMLTKAFFNKSFLINKEISDPENITTSEQSSSKNWGEEAETIDRFNKSNMRLINISDAVSNLN